MSASSYEGLFTGLLLVTGESKPGIKEEFLKALSPFSIKIIDQQEMNIRNRYFLTLLYSLDKAHAKAIEQDLDLCAEKLRVDIAIDYADYRENV